MIAAITAVLDVIKSFLGFKQTEMEHKPVLDVVKDKKSLRKGTNYAEQILEITDQYTKYFSKKHLTKYNSLKKKFNKNN